MCSSPRPGVCAKVWVQVCHIPGMERPHGLQPAEPTGHRAWTGLSEGSSPLGFSDSGWEVGCEVSGCSAGQVCGSSGRALFQTFQVTLGGKTPRREHQLAARGPGLSCAPISMRMGEGGTHTEARLSRVPPELPFYGAYPSALPSGHPQSRAQPVPGNYVVLPALILCSLFTFQE